MGDCILIRSGAGAVVPCPVTWLAQLVASGLVYALSLTLYFRRSIVTGPPRRYLYAFIVSLLIAAVTWAAPFTQVSDKVRNDSVRAQRPSAVSHVVRMAVCRSAV